MKKNNYPEDTHPLVPVFDEIWERPKIRGMWKEIVDKRKGDPVLGEVDDVRQETFVHLWEAVVCVERKVKVVVSYIYSAVKNFLMDLLRKISRRKKKLKEVVYLDLGEDAEFLVSPFSETSLAEILGEMERLVGEGQEWRREVLRDVVELSGAREDPNPAVIEKYAAIGNRSPFRAACAVHGVTKKRQEIFFDELHGFFRMRRRRLLLQPLHPHHDGLVKDQRDGLDHDRRREPARPHGNGADAGDRGRVLREGEVDGAKRPLSGGLSPTAGQP